MILDNNMLVHEIIVAISIYNLFNEHQIHCISEFVMVPVDYSTGHAFNTLVQDVAIDYGHV